MKLIQWLRKYWIVAALAFVLVFVIGIPLLINYSYSVDPILITKWDAADVLGYYGDVLGSVVAVAILAVTIIAGRQDALAEARYQQRKESWESVEVKVDAALEALDPLTPLNCICRSVDKFNDSGLQGVIGLFVELNSYEYTLNGRLGHILADANGLDQAEYIVLVDAVQNVSKQYLEMLKKYRTGLQDYVGKQATISIMKDTPESKEFVPLCQMQSISELMSLYNDSQKELQSMHDGIYCDLLRKKSRVFHQIYSELI